MDTSAPYNSVMSLAKFNTTVYLVDLNIKTLYIMLSLNKNNKHN